MSPDLCDRATSQDRLNNIDHTSLLKAKGGIQMVCDLLQKLELLHAARTQINPVDGQEIVKTFYDLLTVLDSKGLALLAFDGIVVAATTFCCRKGRGLPQARLRAVACDPDPNLIIIRSSTVPLGFGDFVSILPLCGVYLARSNRFLKRNQPPCNSS
jgi:hypothetical protein